MKKYLLLIVLICLIFSCSKDSEPEVIIDEPDGGTGKVAVKLYFSEGTEIQRIGVVDLKELNTFSTLLDYEHNGLGVPLGISINERAEPKRLYITESDMSRILRVDVDSTTFRVVYDSDQGVSVPTSIAVDTVSRKIYWANSGSGQIMQGELFGSPDVNPIALFNGDAVIENCLGLVVDHANNKIYFSDNNLHQILVGALDGSGTPTILFDDIKTDNIGCPASLVIDKDKIYWADDCFDNILVGNITGDGSPSVLFSGEEDGISYPTGLAIDKTSKKIYWSETDGNVIARGNLDGTGDKEIVLDAVQANSIALEFE